MNRSYISKFSNKQHKAAKALCRKLKKETKREPTGKPDVVLEQKSAEVRFSLAKAVYVYPQDDGWATDVVFERGNDRTIAQTPDDALFKTRGEAIKQAKAVLRMARRLEHRDGTARSAENLNRSFELCGHSIELDLPRFRGGVRAWVQGIWSDGILSSCLRLFFCSAPAEFVFPSRPARL